MNEDRVFAKCAWRLIPFVVLLLAVNFLDRVNVSFAALTMNRDLGFSPSIYGLGAGLFFVGYCLFEVPSNVILTRVGARRWMFRIVATWGVASAATAFVQGPASFYLLRFLLGVAEAGLYPGLVFYLTLWFPQAYRARFLASFIAAAPLASAIGAPVSVLILGMDGVAGLRGWQWLFLLEGSPAVLLSFAVLKVLPDGPARAPWLSGEEKAIIAGRLASEEPAGETGLWSGLRDPRVLALSLVLLGFAFARYGIGLFLPQIVQAMGFSNLATGFIVAVPYVASIGGMVLWARSSDAKGERIWHVALAALLAAAGFAIAGLVQSDLIVLVALTVVTVGIHAAFGPFFCLPSSFLSGPAAAAGIAFITTVSNLGGLLGPTVVGVLREVTGDYGAGMFVLALGLVMSAGIALGLGRAMSPQTAPASPHAGVARMRRLQ
jgi:ACS family tartrate transporter-like MFS transporter